jgi:hypothetical protein
MFSWGAITIGLGGTQNFGSVTGVRFLLGVFEAGISTLVTQSFRGYANMSSQAYFPALFIT